MHDNGSYHARGMLSASTLTASARHSPEFRFRILSSQSGAAAVAIDLNRSSMG
jgi:hypothetical protein